MINRTCNKNFHILLVSYFNLVLVSLSSKSLLELKLAIIYHHVLIISKILKENKIPVSQQLQMLYWNSIVTLLPFLLY